VWPVTDTLPFKKLRCDIASPVDEFVSVIRTASDDLFLVGDQAGKLTALSCQDGRSVWSRQVHTGGIRGLDVSHDSFICYSGGDDGFLVATDISTGEERYRVSLRADPRLSDWVSHLCWSATENVLAASCGKRLFFLSDDLRPTAEPRVHPSTIQDITWDEKGKRVATVCCGGGTIWSPNSDEALSTWHDKVVMLSVRWASSGKYVACGCQDSSILVWDVNQKQNLRMWGYPGKVSTLAWDRAGRYLATSGQGDLIVWDFSGEGPSGKEPIHRGIHQGIISAIAFNPKGSMLCTTGDDGSIIVWRTGSFEPCLYGVGSAGISALTWSRDGRRILVGQQDGGVRIFAVDA
jgi:WD40 repeat protein